MFDDKYRKGLFFVVWFFFGFPAIAQNYEPNSDLRYESVVDFTASAEVIAHLEIVESIVVEAERSPNLADGFVRLYIEAAAITLLFGETSLDGNVRYLVDVPLGFDDRAPVLIGQRVLVFGRKVAGRPSDIQLVHHKAQQPYSPTLQQAVISVVSDLGSSNKPPVITGIIDAFSVPGNLTGESETQIFLSTVDGSPASLTVLRRPGRAPAWGVSWTEIIDRAAQPPEANTLEWYRLACSLPEQLPEAANQAQGRDSKAQAERDYQMIMGELGPCLRI